MGVAPSHRARIRSNDLPTLRGPLIRLKPKLSTEDAWRVWRQRTQDPDELVVLDLFSGAGGLSLGFQQAGFFVAAALDHDVRSIETHAANFLAHSRTVDLAILGASADSVRTFVDLELELPRVDVIIGGPPCQGFASVGRAKIRSLREEQRTRLAQRNHLYQEFLRFVEVLRPLCFVMENVPQLATYDDGRVAARIRDDFERLQYDVGASGVGDPWLLKAERYGVPETRQRLFFVGVRRGFTGPVSPPRPTHQAIPLKREITDRLSPTQLSFGRRGGGWAELYLPQARTLADAIADLPRVTPPSLEHVREYLPESRSDLVASQALRDPQYRSLMRSDVPDADLGVLYDHVVRPVRDDDAKAFLHIPPGGTYRDVPDDYRRYRLEEEHFEDRYYRLPWDRPSRAITAHIAKDGYWYIHPDRDQGRTLSVREAARVQSFPDNFRFAGHRTNMYQQIGNAVPPLVAFAIAQRVREAIDRGMGRGWTPAAAVEALREDARAADGVVDALNSLLASPEQNHVPAG